MKRLAIATAFGAVMAATGSLLLTLGTAPPGRDDTRTPRFDEPGAAARSDLARRQPADGRLDMGPILRRRSAAY